MSSAAAVASTYLALLSTSPHDEWDLRCDDFWSEASGSSVSIGSGHCNLSGSSVSVPTAASVDDVVSHEWARRLIPIRESSSLQLEADQSYNFYGKETSSLKETSSRKLVADSNSRLTQRPHQRKRDKVKACLRRSLCCFGCESADSFGLAGPAAD